MGMNMGMNMGLNMGMNMNVILPELNMDLFNNIYVKLN